MWLRFVGVLAVCCSLAGWAAGQAAAAGLSCSGVSATTQENQPVSVSFSCTGAPISSYSIVSGPSDGTAVVMAAGTATYTPNSGYIGSDSFIYQASSTQTGTSSQATVSITVLPPPPVCSNISASTVEDQPVTVILSCTNAPAAETSTFPAHGTLGGSYPSVAYTPDSGYSGSDSFTYFAQNSGGLSNTATVTITVTKPPAPVCANASASTHVNTILTVSLACTNSPSSMTLTAAPAYGTVVDLEVGPPPSVTYMPRSGYIGSDSLTYVTCNLGGCSSPASVLITVTPPPPPPNLVIKPALEAIVTSLRGSSQVIKSGHTATLKVYLKRSSAIWNSGETAFVQLTITDPPSLFGRASMARSRRFGTVTFLYRAHPGKNVIRVRKVKGRFLPQGKYKFTIRVVVGKLRGPAHVFKIKIVR